MNFLILGELGWCRLDSNLGFELFQQAPPWFFTILYISAIASIVATFAYAIQTFAGRRLPASLMYLIWILVVLRFVWVVAPESPTSFLNLFSETRAAVVSIDLLPPVPPVVDFHPSDISTVVNPDAQISESIVAVETFVKPINYSSVAWQMMVWTWAIAVILLFVRLAVQAIGISRLVRNSSLKKSNRLIEIIDATNKTDSALSGRGQGQIRITHELEMPATVGLLRPVILIPYWCESELTDEQLKFILAHELIHVRRKDVLIQLLVHFVMILHWFNPIARYVRNRIAEYREVTCDQRVITTFGSSAEDTIRVYAETILQVVERCNDSNQVTHKPEWMPGFVGQNKNIIRERIQMLDQKNSSSAVAIGLACIVTLVAVGFTTAQTKQEQPSLSAAILPVQAGSALSGLGLQTNNTKPESAESIIWADGLKDVTVAFETYEGNAYAIGELVDRIHSGHGGHGISGNISQLDIEKLRNELTSRDARLVGRTKKTGKQGSNLELKKLVKAERIDLAGKPESISVGYQLNLTPRWSPKTFVMAVSAMQRDLSYSGQIIKRKPVAGVNESEMNSTVRFESPNDHAMLSFHRIHPDDSLKTQVVVTIISLVDLPESVTSAAANDARLPGKNSRTQKNKPKVAKNDIQIDVSPQPVEHQDNPLVVDGVVRGNFDVKTAIRTPKNLTDLSASEKAAYSISIYRGKKDLMNEILEELVSQDSVKRDNSGRISRVGMMGLNEAAWGNGKRYAKFELNALLEKHRDKFPKAAENKLAVGSQEALVVSARKSYTFRGRQQINEVQKPFRHDYPTGSTIQITPVRNKGKLCSVIRAYHLSLGSNLPEHVHKSHEFDGNWMERPSLWATNDLGAITVPDGESLVVWSTGTFQDESAKAVAEDDALIVIIKPSENLISSLVTHVDQIADSQSMINDLRMYSHSIPRDPGVVGIRGALERRPSETSSNSPEQSTAKTVSHDVEVQDKAKHQIEDAKKLPMATKPWTNIGYKVECYEIEAHELNSMIPKKRVDGHDFLPPTTTLGPADDVLQVQFRQKLKQLVADSKAKLIDQPTLVAQWNRPAEFLSGKEIPCESGVVEKGLLVPKTVEFVVLGFRLQLTPYSHPTSDKKFTAITATHSELKAVDRQPLHKLYVSRDSNGKYIKKPNISLAEIQTSAPLEEGVTTACIAPGANKKGKQKTTLLLITPRPLQAVKVDFDSKPARRY